MSASTSSNTGSAAVSAGGRSPAWCSSAASPSVFSATVLPPVFGPLITSTREAPRSRSIGTAVARSSSGCLAPSSRTSSPGVTGAPRHPRETIPRASARSISPAASTSATKAAARAPTEADSSRRIRATSSRSAPAASACRLPSSTIASGSTKSVWPLSETSWTIPGTLSPRTRLDGEDGSAAALRDEVLLQVLAQTAGARQPLQLLGDAQPALAHLLAQPPQRRRGRVAQIGAVLLDRPADLLDEPTQGGLDRQSELAQQRRLRAERVARPQPACHRVGNGPQG